MEFVKRAKVVYFIAIILLLSLLIIGGCSPQNRGSREKESQNQGKNIRNNDLEDKEINEEDKQTWEDQEPDSLDSEKGIQTEAIELYVQDICITPQTLQFMVANNGLELVDMDEDSATIQTLNEEQRIVLREELSKMGEIKEVGEKTGTDQVQVFILNVVDNTNN